MVSVERGGHFNTIVGYWERSAGERLVYTADPLDGALRYWEQKPMRWQRYEVTNDMMAADMLGMLLVFDQSFDGGCEPGGWAAEIDGGYPGYTICI